LNLNEVRTFVTVARTGSILAAAKQLHMTQSAVSRLVQRLVSISALPCSTGRPSR
jgi:DNA-binding transcriptional LysR family regulator